MNELHKFLDSLRNGIRPVAMIEIIYILKAWAKLSNDGLVDQKHSFDKFYNQKIDINKLSTLFYDLAKDHKLFKLYDAQSNYLSSIGEAELGYIFNWVKVQPELPKVNDAFFSSTEYGFTIANQVAELGIKLLNKDIESIYVPFTDGFAYAYYTDRVIYAEQMSQKNALIAELINILDGGKIDFKIGDALSAPQFINQAAPHLLEQFDATFSFPPMNCKGKVDIKDAFNRFNVYNGAATLDVAYFEHILAQTKRSAVVLTSVGLTYRSGLEQSFRKELIEHNLLEAIIQLPPNLHSATSIETTFFVINKFKCDTEVLFINLNDEKFITRDGRKLVLKDINKILEIYRNKTQIEGVSALITYNQIISKNYSFAIDKYIISKESAEYKNRLKNYTLVRLEDIAEIRRSQLFKDEETGEEVYEITPSDFNSSGFTNTGSKIKKLGSQKGKYETYKLQPYDILLSTKGTIGKVAILDKLDKPMVTSQANQVIRLKGQNIKDKAICLYMFFKSDIGQSFLNQLVVGVAMPQIATSEIKELLVPLVDEEKQNTIISNFYYEIDLDDEINNINSKISVLRNDF